MVYRSEKTVLPELTNEMWDWIYDHRTALKPEEAAFYLAVHKPDWPRLFIVQQIEGYKKCLTKFPFLSGQRRIIFPKRLSVEQASSESTAGYKATLIENSNVTDLTCGFGIDALILAQTNPHVTAIEPDKELAEIVMNNASRLEIKNLTVVQGFSENYLSTITKTVDWMIIDPDRRDERGNKIVSFSDSAPNVIELLPIIQKQTQKLMVKASPMLDITKAAEELGSVSECHVVSVNNECKELLFISDFGVGSLAGEFKLVCVNLKTDQPVVTASSRAIHQAEVVESAEMGSYLFEFNSSIMKAGIWDSSASNYGLSAVHPQTHLFTSDTKREHFPGYQYRVISQCEYNKKGFQKITTLRKFNIVPKNFPDSNNQIAKRLGIREGGNKFLFCYKDYQSKYRLAVAERLK